MFLKQKCIRHTVSSGSVTNDYVGVKQIGTTVLLGYSTNHLFPILLPLKQAETHTCYMLSLISYRKYKFISPFFFTLIPTKGDTAGKK